MQADLLTGSTDDGGTCLVHFECAIGGIFSLKLWDAGLCQCKLIHFASAVQFSKPETF